MTVQSPITPAGTDDRWSAVTGAANQWRGAAIQVFAQTEFAVSETLERLSLVPERGKLVRLRPLVGQRFADLADALSGPFAAEGGKAAEALEKFRRHEALRSILCHGVAKVLQERTGEWAVILRLVTLKGRRAERSSRTVEQKEAEQLLAGFRRTGGSSLRRCSRCAPAFPADCCPFRRPGGSNRISHKIRWSYADGNDP